MEPSDIIFMLNWIIIFTPGETSLSLNPLLVVGYVNHSESVSCCYSFKFQHLSDSNDFLIPPPPPNKVNIKKTQNNQTHKLLYDNLITMPHVYFPPKFYLKHLPFMPETMNKSTHIDAKFIIRIVILNRSSKVTRNALACTI